MEHMLRPTLLMRVCLSCSNILAGLRKSRQTGAFLRFDWRTTIIDCGCFCASILFSYSLFSFFLFPFFANQCVNDVTLSQRCVTETSVARHELYPNKQLKENSIMDTGKILLGVLAGAAAGPLWESSLHQTKVRTRARKSRKRATNMQKVWKTNSMSSWKV